MDESLEIYSDGSYSDPAFRFSPWSCIDKEGYRVEQLQLGTQTGTHIDAPAHFEASGATLEALPVDRLMGGYYLIDLPAKATAPDLERSITGYADEPILFLRSHECSSSEMTHEAIGALIGLPPMVWVLAGKISILGQADLEFHRMLARAGKYLVEDLDPVACASVPPHGEIFALPLALVGTSGAPCRVVVRAIDPLESRIER